jgi:hypothetical protein
VGYLVYNQIKHKNIRYITVPLMGVKTERGSNGSQLLDFMKGICRLQRFGKLFIYSDTGTLGFYEK